MPPTTNQPGRQFHIPEMSEMPEMKEAPDETTGKYRFIDLFAGIGGFRFGFEPKGGECVWSCEIDRFSRRTYVHNHDEQEENIFPDVRDATPSDVPDHDILIAGFACFGKETQVLTERGYISIPDVNIGDRVLTHKGRWMPVTAVMSRENADLRRIKAQGVPGIITTNEHPFYTRKQGQKWNNDKRSYDIILGDPEWTNAEVVNKKFYVSQVIPEVSQNEFSHEFWWIVGRYLADGYRGQRHHTSSGNLIPKDQGRVVISCDRKETQEIEERIQALGYHSTTSHAQSADNHIITNQKLYQFLEPFGQYSYGKRLPRVALELEPDKAKSLLEGYMSGDGSKPSEQYGMLWETGSVSKALALGIALLAQRAYGVVATVIEYQPRSKTHVIEGRTVNQRKRWKVTIPKRNRSGIIEDQYAWKLVRSSNPTGEQGQVWNISVDQDESYVADGAIVHNCQPFSKAGVSKNQSLNRPHGFADETRGTLFFQIVRLLATHRPAAFLLENVPHLLNHDKGRTFATVEYLLTKELGYQISHRVIDARPYVPQRRRRIFISGHQQKDRPGLDQLELPPEEAGPVLGQILHPGDGSEEPEAPYTSGPQAEPGRQYTLGEKTWLTLQRHRSRHTKSGNGFGYSLADLTEPSRTLTARYGKDGQEILIPQEGQNPRRLTPRECSRLMGMPNLVIPVSDIQAYRQLGNSVVPPLVEALAENLMA